MFELCAKVADCRILLSSAGPGSAKVAGGEVVGGEVIPGRGGSRGG